MAEDPRIKAHNDRTRIERENAEREAIAKAGRISTDSMQRQIEADGRKLQDGNGTKSGCSVVVIALLGVPAALGVAYRMIA
ncbi:hypothetical protein WG908_08045 [Sphingobium sp. AN641]|uniref:hypothetical protein n=1 Tax=Sphingobium sp. AN641 TaxID=3133443 RepID=UPI0030C47C19